MSKRWLSGVLTFALGFGCTSLATNATAQELPEDSGELEAGLSYINTARDITLINRGRYVYVVMIQREPGTAPVDVPVEFNEGIMTVSGFNVSRAVAYRLEPVAILQDDFWRPCFGGDCSWMGPLPPPPPPPVEFPDPSAKFLAPSVK